MGLQVQHANTEDRQWAARLMADSEPWKTLHRTLEDCERSVSDPLYHIFIARNESERAGFIMLQDAGVAGSPYVKSIAVHPLYRGKGVGTRLLTFAEEYYRERSRHIFLCVSSFNTRAQQFYRSNGWINVGELRDYVVEGYSELLFYKRIR